MVLNQFGTISWNKWLIVIPARMGSERLKNKPLQLLGDKPLVVRTYENISSLQGAGATIIVATDHAEIMQCCAQHGIQSLMTDPNHRSGTDRVFEVSKKYHSPYVMNLQGDEPFMNQEDVAKLMSHLERDSQADVATLVYRSHIKEDYLSPTVVKAVKSQSGRALYFSRSPIPHDRDQLNTQVDFWHHQGIYAYRRESLQQFCNLMPSALEKLEQLEQLRALENGMHIQLVEASHSCKGIDTKEDLEAAHALL